MSAWQLLRERGPMEARHIAEVLGRPLDEVYAELVQAESCGLVRIVSHRGHVKYREWEANAAA